MHMDPVEYPYCLLSPSEVMMDTDGDQSCDSRTCTEQFPSSPGCPTSDTYLEYGKLHTTPAVSEISIIHA